jgi:hypothetical protein
MEHGPLCRERDDVDVEAKLSCERVDQGGLSTEKRVQCQWTPIYDKRVTIFSPSRNTMEKVPSPEGDS